MLRRYTLFMRHDFKAKAKYLTKFIELDNLTWENVFTIPIFLKCNNKLKELQCSRICIEYFQLNIS